MSLKGETRWGDTAEQYRRNNPFAYEDIHRILTCERPIVMGPSLDVHLPEAFTLITPQEISLTPDSIRYNRMQTMYEDMLKTWGKVELSTVPVGFKRARDSE